MCKYVLFKSRMSQINTGIKLKIGILLNSLISFTKIKLGGRVWGSYFIILIETGVAIFSRYFWEGQGAPNFYR